MNFGPVNFPGGERRLNVAVTRARRKVVVVSSIRASDFDMTSVTPPGVKALYRYLDYAERGPDSLLIERTNGDFESPLEQEVAFAIRALGYEVVPQVGCSGFRIDLGVIHPRHPGEFLLGVECDGALYHSAATARDRDRLRQQVLERLGWRIYRVWSPDWVGRRKTEIERLEKALARAEAEFLRRVAKPKARSDNSGEKLTVVEHAPPDPDDWSTPKWVVKYKVARPPLNGGGEMEESLNKAVLDISETEGPVHVEVVIRRIARALGWERTGSRLTSAIERVCRKLKRQGLINTAGQFVQPGHSDFRVCVRTPDPRDTESKRKIEHISDEEISLAMANVVGDALSIPDDRLLVMVARIFGFDRTGNHIQQRLRNVLGKLVKSNALSRSDERITKPK